MEQGERERFSAEPVLHQDALDLLIWKSRKLSARVVSRSIVSRDFGAISAELPERISEEIRSNKQQILHEALRDEWRIHTEDDYPLHRLVGIEQPSAEGNEGKTTAWKEPDFLPELPQEYLEACLKSIHVEHASFAELQYLHMDFLAKPKLFSLIQSLDYIAQSDYRSGAGDAAFDLVAHALFRDDFTLDADRSLYLLGFLPPESSELVRNLLSANQIMKNMEHILEAHDLSDDERMMISAVRAVLRSAALTGPAWHHFAVEHGGIMQRGSEQLTISVEGLEALLTVKRLQRRDSAGNVLDAYVSALEQVCSQIKSVQSDIVLNSFAVMRPEDTIHSIFSFNSPLLFVLTPANEHTSDALQPAKAYPQQRAVIVDESVKDSLQTRFIIDAQTPFKVDEDSMFRDMRRNQNWMSDPAVAQVNVAVTSSQLAHYMEEIPHLIRTRQTMAEDASNPDFTLVLWSSETETVTKLYQWFRELAFSNQEIGPSVRSGLLAYEAPYHPSDRQARIKIRIQPKVAILPQPGV